MKHLISLFIVPLLMAGCVSEPLKIDPQERQLLGRVINNEEVGSKEHKEHVEHMERERVIFMYGALGYIAYEAGYLPSTSGTYDSNQIDSTIQTKEGLIVIRHRYKGFHIGECVKLFLSEKPEEYPPRIAYGSGCE